MKQGSNYSWSKKKNMKLDRKKGKRMTEQNVFEFSKTWVFLSEKMSLIKKVKKNISGKSSIEKVRNEQKYTL